MAWIKLDDSFGDHPKVVAAGPLAAWLYVRGLCYCGRHLTDGFIPHAAVPTLGSFAAGRTRPQGLAEALVKVGLWEASEGGYQVHDYGSYQRSAEQVRKEREESRQRKERWLEQQKNAVRNANGTAVERKKNGDGTLLRSESDPEVKTNPLTPPLDGGQVKPKRKRRSKAELAAQEPPGFPEFYAAYPLRLARGAAAKAYADALATGLVTAAEINAGLEKTRAFLAAQGEFCPHPASWLNARRWTDDPNTSTSKPSEPTPLSRRSVRDVLGDDGDAA